MTTPTFADADAALATHDYGAALAILERIDVVGEDACYRRDIQAAASGVCCLLFYVGVARSLFPGARWGVFLLYIASVIGVRVYMAAQISMFNRTLPRGVRLSFMRLGGRFPALRAKAIACVYAVVIVGFFLICIMSGLS